jgi:hypothetical protein
MEGRSLVDAWAGGTLGLLAGVVTLVILAIRRALEGKSAIDFADLATAAVVGIAIGLVPVATQALAMRSFRRHQGMPGYSADDPDQEPMARGGDRFETFTRRARNALELAQDESRRFNHDYIGTEHVLLGLIREGEGTGARALMNLGVDLDKVRMAVEFIIGRGDQPTRGEMGLTPRTKRVIELSIDEAHRLGHGYIGTEHLLLGLIREGDGIAAGVLQSLGLDLDKVRAEVMRLLAGGPPED